MASILVGRVDASFVVSAGASWHASWPDTSDVGIVVRDRLGSAKLVHMARSKRAPIGRDQTGDYFSFGKHEWMYVRWVAQNDLSYLTWILGQENFSDGVKVACRKAIAWAESGPGPWSGPARAESAEKAVKKAASSKFMADVDRIWKDRDDD